MSGTTYVASTSAAGAVTGPGNPNVLATVFQSCKTLNLGSSPRMGIGFLYASRTNGMLYPLLATLCSFTRLP